MKKGEDAYLLIAKWSKKKIVFKLIQAKHREIKLRKFNLRRRNY